MGQRIDFLVRRLTEEEQVVTKFFTNFSADAWDAPVYGPSTGSEDATGRAWTVKDLLAHLVSAEGAHRAMIADVARGGPGAPPGLDLDKVNAARVAELRQFDPDELMARLHTLRMQVIALVAGLTDEDLDRRGRHPGLGELAVEDFAKAVFRHAKVHLRDVQRALEH